MRGLPRHVVWQAARAHARRRVRRERRERRERESREASRARAASSCAGQQQGGGDSGEQSTPSSAEGAGFPPSEGTSVPERKATDPPEGRLDAELRRRLDHWRAIGASPRILSWIARGVPVRWRKRAPRPFRFKPYVMDAEQEAWFRGELPRLEELGAFQRVQTSQYVSPAFLVPKPDKADGSKDFRLVVDLRWVNSHCVGNTCKFETLKALRTMAKRGEYLFSFDIKDGYYMVSIAEEFADFFTFAVKMDGEIVYVRCRGLAMGWINSPYVFTKLMRPVVRYLRAPMAAAAAAATGGVARPPPDPGEARRLLRRDGPYETRGVGLRCLAYIDDFLGVVRTETEARLAMEFVDRTLGRLGIRRHPSKGHFAPTQQLVHLGLEVDMKRGEFRVTDKRAGKLRGQAKDLLCKAARSQRWVLAKELAAFIGLAASCDLAMPACRLYLRSLHDGLKARTSWSGHARLDKQALRDLRWWAEFRSGQKENGRKLWRPPTTQRLYTDAAGEAYLGWGAVLGTPEGPQARGSWRQHQQELGITLKELKAVRFGVEAFLSQLRGRYVRLDEDNMGVVYILGKLTTREPRIMRELRKVWRLLSENDISLEVHYIRSADNPADAPSRARDRDDWMLHPELFRWFDRNWHGHDVDRFASATNAQVPVFNSRWPSPGCVGVDAFAEDWNGVTSWINPPWGVLGRVVAKLRDSPGAAATVVAPFWPSAVWWPGLVELASEVRLLDQRFDLFLPGAGGNSAGVGRPSWRAVACRIEPRGSLAAPSRNCG